MTAKIRKQTAQAPTLKPPPWEVIVNPWQTIQRENTVYKTKNHMSYINVTFDRMQLHKFGEVYNCMITIEKLPHSVVRLNNMIDDGYMQYKDIKKLSVAVTDYNIFHYGKASNDMITLHHIYRDIITKTIDSTVLPKTSLSKWEMLFLNEMYQKYNMKNKIITLPKKEKYND